MKTYNVNPHSGGNKPVAVQGYASTLRGKQIIKYGEIIEGEQQPMI
jgi:hypothetical protein